MNPILQAIIHTVLRPKRVCPKCKRAQTVSVSKKSERVRCKFCGAKVPSR